MGWYAEFVRWHISTEHPWDVALHHEAMLLGIKGIRIEIDDRLSPILEKVSRDLERLLR